jgi:hypothetical protein
MYFWQPETKTAMGKKAARRKQEETIIQQTATVRENVVVAANQFTNIQALLVFLFAFLLYANTITHDFALVGVITNKHTHHHADM